MALSVATNANLPRLVTLIPTGSTVKRTAPTGTTTMKGSASSMSSLTMTRGNTALFDTTVSNLGSGGLTGFSAWFTAKRDPSDPDAAAVFQKTIASGVAITTPGNATTPGVLTTTVAPSDTETLPTGYAVVLMYDVKVKDGSGIETTVDSGTITVHADVTQSI